MEKKIIPPLIVKYLFGLEDEINDNKYQSLAMENREDGKIVYSLPLLLDLYHAGYYNLYDDIMIMINLKNNFTLTTRKYNFYHFIFYN